MQEKKLNAISKHIEQISSKAEYFLTTIFAIEAIVLKCLGQEKEAKERFEKISILNDPNEQHWIYAAHLELAEIAFINNRYNLTQALLERISKKKISGFEWEDTGYQYVKYQKFVWDLKKKKDPYYNVIPDNAVVGVKKLTHRPKSTVKIEENKLPLPIETTSKIIENKTQTTTTTTNEKPVTKVLKTQPTVTKTDSIVSKVTPSTTTPLKVSTTENTTATTTPTTTTTTTDPTLPKKISKIVKPGDKK